MSDLLSDVRFEVKIAIDAGLHGDVLANAIVARLCRRLGGATVHWPRIDREVRDAAIRADHASGLSRPDIARRNGVTLRTVDRVVG